MGQLSSSAGTSSVLAIPGEESGQVASVESDPALAEGCSECETGPGDGEAHCPLDDCRRAREIFSVFGPPVFAGLALSCETLTDPRAPLLEERSGSLRNRAPPVALGLEKGRTGARTPQRIPKEFLCWSTVRTCAPEVMPGCRLSVREAMEANEGNEGREDMADQCEVH